MSHFIAAAKSKEPTMTHIIRGDQQVIGVTSLGDKLFVLHRPSKQEIKVYNSNNFEQRQSIKVHGLVDNDYIKGLTSSDVENCLLVSDLVQGSIYRIDLSNDNKVSRWPVVGGKPRQLSMNAANNVIVACRDDAIREYTTNGRLVRTVKPSESDASYLFHSIQLTRDQFVFSHLRPVHGVSVMDTTGKVLRSCRNDQSTETQFDCPCQLAVTKNGCVLVADSDNNRILILNSALTRARDLSLPVDGGLNRPVCLYLDESRGRLVVGEWRGKRVLVFDNINCFDV